MVQYGAVLVLTSVIHRPLWLFFLSKSFHLSHLVFPECPTFSFLSILHFYLRASLQLLVLQFLDMVIFSHSFLNVMNWCAWCYVSHCTEGVYVKFPVFYFFIFILCVVSSWKPVSYVDIRPWFLQYVYWYILSNMCLCHCDSIAISSKRLQPGVYGKWIYLPLLQKVLVELFKPMEYKGTGWQVLP